MTVKGYQKKMIVLKNVDSEIFDEVQFILRSDPKGAGYSDIIKEAERIISESTFKEVPERSPFRKRYASLLYFLSGLFCGVSLCAAVIVIFHLL